MGNSTALEYTYRYPYASRVGALSGGLGLHLATCDGRQAHPHFFDGKLRHPREAAQMLLVLSRIVATHFFLPRPVLRDPVVTSSESMLRFEGFSGCCGVYARVDLPPESFGREFQGRGTTNVDFNNPMRNALARLRESDEVRLAVGRDAVVLEKAGESVVEKKVQLPLRWVKGFSEVQLYEPKLALKGVVRYALPQPVTYQWLKTTHPNVAPNVDFYVYSMSSPPATNASPNAVSKVELRKKPQLTIATAQCQKSGCDINTHGFATFENAKFGYFGRTKNGQGVEVNAELAGVKSAPDAFHDFIGFKVSGEANVYKSGDGNTPEDFLDLDGFERIYPVGGLYKPQLIYVEMAQDVEVTPVYKLKAPTFKKIPRGVKDCPYLPEENPDNLPPLWGPEVELEDCGGNRLTRECAANPVAAYEYKYVKSDGSTTLIGKCVWECGDNQWVYEYIGLDTGPISNRIIWGAFHVTSDDPCGEAECNEGLRNTDSEGYTEGYTGEYSEVMDWKSHFREFYTGVSEDLEGFKNVGALSEMDCSISLSEAGYLTPAQRGW